MIIGNGLLAQAFRPVYEHDPELVIFASGVSNSRETRAEQFTQEREMLRAACKMEKALVYFSTCSVHDAELAQTPYVRHKLELEAIVAQLPRFAIFRLPQVVGRTPNPHTLTNFLFQQIKNGSEFSLWRHARRNLIDVEDVAKIANCLLQQHSAEQIITNIACPFSVNMFDLVQVFEDVTGIKASYKLVEAGGSYAIDTKLACSVAPQAGVVFDDFYIKHLIQKYYGSLTIEGR